MEKVDELEDLLRNDNTILCITETQQQIKYKRKLVTFDKNIDVFS